MRALTQAYKQAAGLCKVKAAGNRLISPKAMLQQLAERMADDELSDQYGEGALIENFEREVASLLGKQAALFLPSGTMAQNIALKIWANERHTDAVAMHHTSHLLLHENNAIEELYQLKPIILGEVERLPTLDNIKEAASQALAAILLELPMREIGGQLPQWNDLVAQSKWLRAQNIALHMDGARLWQCPDAYHKSLAEITALFDSVYVSFYKDMGGISGACLVGEQGFIDKARLWLRRAGGNLFSLYPYVVAAREGLKTHLPQMRRRKEDAIWLAQQLNQLAGMSTWPRTPQTNMFRLKICTNSTQFLSRSIEWMQAKSICLIRTPYETAEHHLMAEITIGDEFSRLDRTQWLQAIEHFETDVLGA